MDQTKSDFFTGTAKSHDCNTGTQQRTMTVNKFNNNPESLR